MVTCAGTRKSTLVRSSQMSASMTSVSGRAMKNQAPKMVLNQWGSRDMAQSKDTTLMTTA